MKAKWALGITVLIGLAILLLPSVAMAADDLSIGQMAKNIRSDLKDVAWTMLVVLGCAMIYQALRGHVEKVLIMAVIALIPLGIVFDPKEIGDIAKGVWGSFTGS